MADKTLLIGDIGGTNARFALAAHDHPGFSDVMTLQCDEFASTTDAIRHYLGASSVDDPDVICLAAAGPVIDSSIKMTNNHWTLRAADIATDFDVDAVRLLNDFEALAYSIPKLGADDCLSIGLPAQRPLPVGDYDVVILGPGTGLGAAGLCRRGAALVPIVGEAGHSGFAPRSPLQIELLKLLQDKFDRVTIERLVSGAGVENLYWALTAIYGEKQVPVSAADVFEHADNGSDARALQTTQLFFEILGQVAGDLALTMGAQDGVYVAGGIAKRYPQMMQNSEFRNAFDDKGDYRAYMERIPTQLIMRDEPGLLGAARCAFELSGVTQPA